MRIKYDGVYPNLCSGMLIIEIDNNTYTFPDYCLESGGSVTFDSNWEEHVSEGAWLVNEWPDGFPDELKSEALELINQEIPQGCCGGCI
jgi:hypothetical protein